MRSCICACVHMCMHACVLVITCVHVLHYFLRLDGVERGNSQHQPLGDKIVSREDWLWKYEGICFGRAKGAAVRFVLVCAHSHVVDVYLSMYSTCVYVNKCLCTVNKDSVKSSCVPLPPQPPSFAPHPPCWSCLTMLSSMHMAACWYHFDLVLQRPPPGGHQGHREG